MYMEFLAEAEPQPNEFMLENEFIAFTGTTAETLLQSVLDTPSKVVVSDFIGEVSMARIACKGYQDGLITVVEVIDCDV